MAGRRTRSRPSSTTQPDGPLFILDECLSGTLVREALETAGLSVKTVFDLFGRGAQDLEWMPKAGARGDVVVTRDNRIRRHRAERQAFIDAKVRGFFLAARGNLRGDQMAEILAENAPRMLRAATTYAAPFIAIVRRGGIEVLDDDDCPKRKIPKKHRSE